MLVISVQFKILRYMVNDAEECYLGKDDFSGPHNGALTFVSFPLAKVCLPEIQTCPHVSVLSGTESFYPRSHILIFYICGLRF